MSRLISEQAAAAFYAGKKWKQKNTRTEDFKLYLHENLIAKIENGRLYITLHGWNTITTRERLNALNGVNLTQRNFEPYLNGEKIDSCEWYEIKNF